MTDTTDTDQKLKQENLLDNLWKNVTGRNLNQEQKQEKNQDEQQYREEREKANRDAFFAPSEGY